MELQGILCELQGFFFMENRNLAVTNQIAPFVTSMI